MMKKIDVETKIAMDHFKLSMIVKNAQMKNKRINLKKGISTLIFSHKN
jgi:hypothetical protein